MSPVTPASPLRPTSTATATRPPALRRAAGLRSSSLVGLAILVAGSVTVLAPAVTAARVQPDQPDQGVPGVAPDPRPRSSARALELLDRVAAADQRVRYSGVQFVSAWSAHSTVSALVELRNVPGEGRAIRVRGSGQDASASMFTSTPAELGAQVGGGPVELLARHYSVSRAGTGDVTGRPTRVLEMTGAGGVVAARFWVDRRTGVLLRREVYDVEGRTVRASAYVQIKIGRWVPSGHLPPAMPSASAEQLSVTELADAPAETCACPEVVAGHLALYQVRRVTTSTGTALHLSYSDGLSTVSVFQQDGQLDPAAMTGYEQVPAADGVRYVRGALPHQVVWSAEGTMYAVLADAPEPVVADVVDALPQERAAPDGIADRVGRGLGRVGSWLNPFS